MRNRWIQALRPAPSQVAASRLSDAAIGVRERVQQTLPAVVEVLDAVALLPLEAPWLETGNGLRFVNILKVLEGRYLHAWARAQSDKVDLLEREILLWFRAEQRSASSLFREYCRWHQRWWCAHPEGWGAYVLSELSAHPMMAAQHASAEPLEEEWELLLTEWFRVARPLVCCDLFQIVSDFYAFHSVFTQTEVFLPALSPPRPCPDHVLQVLQALETGDYPLAARAYAEYLTSSVST